MVGMSKRVASKPNETSVEPPPPKPPEPEQPKPQVVEDFWEQLNQVTPEQWQSGWRMYLYRSWPVIDKTGESHYLCIFREPIDEDAVLQAYGSGKYSLWLKNNKNVKVRTHSFSIHNPKFPPKVRLEEVVKTDARNDLFFKVWVEDSAATTNSPAYGANPDSASAAAIKELGSTVRTLIDRDHNRADSKDGAVDAAVVELWKETSKQRDELSTRLATIGAGQAGRPAETFEMFDKMLSLVEKLHQPAAPLQNPLDQVRDAMDLMTKMRDVFGSNQANAIAASAEESIPWKEILGALGPALVPLAQGLTSKLLGLTATPAASVAAVPTGIGTPRLPAEGMATAAPNNGATAAAPPPQTTQEADAQRQLQQLYGVALRVVTCLERGLPGYALAEAISTMHGYAQYQQIAEAGHDGIMLGLQMFPDVWIKLAPIKPQVERFVQEFLKYGEAEPESDVQESAATPTAA